MVRLTIDNQETEVPRGATLLDAAAKLGIDIPTMCFLKSLEPPTSCMLCVVDVQGRQGLLPACGTIAEDGMRVRTNTDRILQARKTALELLLSDHVGDCLGPCQLACPARMNIPLMLRQIAGGRLSQAIATVKHDIALPAVLGRICPAPCEEVCRRAQHDQAVAICQMKRYVADADLKSPSPYLPDCLPSRDKRVAIVGAGPAGLAAAYRLLQDGLACTVFDDHDQPGGMLRYEVSQNELPRDVLDAEIALIIKLGLEFKGATRLGADFSLEGLLQDYHAVFIATGQSDLQQQDLSGLEFGPKGIITAAGTYQTNLPGVFAGGGAIGSRRLAVRALADGKEAAAAIAQYLSGQTLTTPPRLFNSRMGRLQDGEMELFLTGAESIARFEPADPGTEYSAQQAASQARRCLHCDCRKLDNCKLRHHAQQYSAGAGRFKAERRTFVQESQHDLVVFEPGKCIDCGLCIQITSQAGEELGLAFVGRGFDVRVSVPFGRSLAEALQLTADRCVAACPTGALALKDNAVDLQRDSPCGS